MSSVDLEVGEIHHQRGRERIEAERLVGPVLEHAVDDELARADRDRGTDVGAEAREQPVLEPDTARGRRAGHRIAARRADGVGEPHLAAQRITVADGIEARELARVARDDDRRERRELRGSQAAPLGLGEVVGVQRVAAGLKRRSAASMPAASCATLARTRSMKKPMLVIAATATVSAIMSTVSRPARKPADEVAGGEAPGSHRADFSRVATSASLRELMRSRR